MQQTSIYKPGYLTPSGSLMSSPVNVAGQTPQTALAQASTQTGLGRTNPANPALRGQAPSDQLSEMQVGPNGEVTYSMRTDPFASRLSMLSKAGVTQGGQPGPQVQHGGIDEGREAAARDAAFGRAKDRAGMVAQSGLKSLKNIMAARGLQGSTIEGDGVMNVLQGGVGQLGGVVREQAINEAGRAGDIADLEYQGGIQQRGQDMQAQQALLSLINRIGAY